MKDRILAKIPDCNGKSVCVYGDVSYGKDSVVFEGLRAELINDKGEVTDSGYHFCLENKKGVSPALEDYLSCLAGAFVLGNEFVVRNVVFYNEMEEYAYSFMEPRDVLFSLYGKQVYKVIPWCGFTYKLVRATEKWLVYDGCDGEKIVVFDAKTRKPVINPEDATHIYYDDVLAEPNAVYIRETKRQNDDELLADIGYFGKHIHLTMADLTTINRFYRRACVQEYVYENCFRTAKTALRWADEIIELMDDGFEEGDAVAKLVSKYPLTYEIYQFKDVWEECRFRSYDKVREILGEVKKDSFNMVFTDTIKADGLWALDVVYEVLNRDEKPEGYNTYSLSVGDCIVLYDPAEPDVKWAFMVCSVGFQELKRFW